MANLEEEPDNDTVCGICYAEFLDIEDLNVHVTQNHLTETNKNQFCKFCLSIFNDIDAFALHIKNHHLNAIKSCRYCIRLYLDEETLSKHEKKHRSSMLFPKIQCSNCDLVFDDKKQLENHEFEKHGDSDDGVMLQYCFAALSVHFNMNARNFFEASHGNFSYDCISCKYSTPDRKAYISHLLTLNCRSLCCDICCNVFSWKSKLENHCSQHLLKIRKNLAKKLVTPETQSEKSLDSPFDALMCSVCSISFSSNDELKHHLTTHSAISTMKVQVCKYCRKPVVGMTALLKHIERTHKHDCHLYKYNCTICNIMFKHPKLLFAHFFTKHQDLRPYTCKICNLKFRIRKKFTLHIKLDHNSVGFVEFDDNFFVYFTDKKCIKTSDSDANKTKESKNNSLLVERNPPYISDSDSNRTDSNNLLVERNLPDISDTDGNKTDSNNLLVERNPPEVTDTDGNKTDTNRLLVERRPLKRTRAMRKQTRSKRDADRDSSSDSDVPLSRIVNKKGKYKPQAKRKKAKFTCPNCNKNCYTYQNFHRHLDLQHKKGQKTCIKCHKKFKTTEELNKHITSDHSSSQLTETLKKLVDQQKKKNKGNKGIHVNTDQFLKTMQKVPTEKCIPATIFRVEKNKLSAKKFLENFTPDNDGKTVCKLTIKPVEMSHERSPVIKMTKFVPETPNPNPKRLQMPVKFQSEPYQKQKVSIKLVHQELNPHLDENNEMTLNYTDDVDYIDDYYDKSEIPEVGHEVMLDGTEMENVKYYKKTIVIKDFIKDHNELRIAHLAPEAPYFKIVKIDDIQDTQKVNVEEKPQPDLRLPNGIKLVSVNPLAHLIDNKSIKEICKSSYKSKLSSIDVNQAIVKAMAVLEKKPVKKVKKS